MFIKHSKPMRNITICFLALLVFSFGLQTIFAQDNPNLLAEFNKVDKKMDSKNIQWAGKWSVSSRHYPAILMITTLSANKFKFKLESSNGANQGEISGTAKFKGNKAYFDDKVGAKKPADYYGCKLLFINKGKSIDIQQSEKCRAYAGNAVYFAQEYRKGKPPIAENDFVQNEVFPNSKIDKTFKLLVGNKEYENFLDDFQLIYDNEDLDKLNAKVFSGCVRGICPWNTGIIMYDGEDNIWAAIMNLDEDKKPKVFYFTNNQNWTNKLPKTIENWVEDKRSSNENLQVIFKSTK
jgi:hypothetical protein